MKTYVLVGGLTSVQPLATCSKDLMDREGGSGKPSPIPHTMTGSGTRLYFPATGIRGKLRRCARDAVRQHVIAATGNETPFSLDQHYFLTLGGIKGSGETSKASVAHEAYWRQKNPLLSVFGAGDAGELGFVAGHLSVGNAVCRNDVAPQVFSGARTDDLYRDRSQAAYLSDDDVQSLVRQAEGNRDQSSVRASLKQLETARRKARREKDEAQVESLSVKIADAEKELADIRDESGSKDVSVGMPLAGYKAIPEGQYLEQRMHLLRSNDVELGLLLAALDVFAREPLLGAHTSNGCGLVAGEWTVYEVTNQGRVQIGAVRFEPFDALQVEGDVLKAAQSALVAALKDADFSIPTTKAAANG
ncbi:hypothetical protein [Alcanivorax sp. 1008]|uniref:hypothetical protein n=1 Tax=Alcanivorax sp. 1008 TaxID=2816853 RepID=UPI001DEBF19C|nr:hypothetical protein [Alcanivorax sp. 1008]MCC1496771.1 hypothetical protein [Alcanivorax sp. 1008]